MSQILRTYSRKGKRVAKDASASIDTSPERIPVARKRKRIEVEVVTDGVVTDGGTSDSETGGGGVEKAQKTAPANSSVSSADRFDSSVAHSTSASSAVLKASHTSHGTRQSSHASSSTSLRTTTSKKAKSQGPNQLPTPPKIRHTQSLSPEKPIVGFADYFRDATIRTDLSTAKAGGIAKRMLRRAHTDSSVNSNRASDPHEVAGSATPTLQRTPTKVTATKTESVIFASGSPGSSRSQPLTPSKSGSLEDALSPDKSTRPSLVNPNVRTYAGKSRSFLVALPAAHTSTATEDFDSQATDTNLDEEDGYEARESYADLRARWGVDNSEDDPYPSYGELPSPSKDPKGKGKLKQTQPVPHLPSGMMNDLKSITELRSKGESRRFLDDVGYLFEGLAPDGAVGVRRASALEIVTKLCDPDFLRKAKAADFLGRAWESLREAGAGEGDKVLDTILVFFAALASQDPVDATDLATRLDFRPTLFRLLGHLTHENDPLWLVTCGVHGPALRSVGVSRNDGPQLEALHRMIVTKSGLFDDSELISNRLLISLSLDALPSIVQQTTTLPGVLSSLTAELAPLSARVSAYIAGLPLLPSVSAEFTTDLPSISHVDNCLHLLDACLLGRWEDDGAVDAASILDHAREEGLGSTLVTLCVALDLLSRTHDMQFTVSIAHKCMESALRVLVNLTHDSALWCQSSIGSPSGLPSILRLLATLHSQKTQSSATGESLDGDDAAATYLDKLCLILGLVTNLVQTSDQAKDHIHDLKLSPLCPGLRPCTVACRCTEAVSALECLVQIYERPGPSENDFESVVRGHIAVLFGLLMQGHPRNQLILLRLLPGPSNRKKVESVMENVREFTLLYAEFAKRAAHAADTADDEDDQSDADSALRASHGEQVVRQVLVFLGDILRNLND